MPRAFYLNGSMSLSASAGPSFLSETESVEVDLGPTITPGSLYWAKAGFTVLREEEMNRPWTKNTSRPPFFEIKQDDVLLYLGAEYLMKTYRSSGNRGFMYTEERMIYLKLLAGEHVVVLPLAVKDTEHGELIRQQAVEAFFWFVSDEPKP